MAKFEPDESDEIPMQPWPADDQTTLALLHSLSLNQLGSEGVAALDPALAANASLTNLS